MNSVLFALLVLQDPSGARADDGDRLLCRIPEGIAIASDLNHASPRIMTGWREALVFAEDGSSAAYVGQRGDQFVPVVLDRVGAAYDGVCQPRLAGGRAFFLVAKRLTETTQHCWIWVDGKTLPVDDVIPDFNVSATGTKVAYWTQPGGKVGDSTSTWSAKHILVVATLQQGGNWSLARGEKWYDASFYPPLLDHDGSVVVSLANNQKGWALLCRQARETVLVPAGAAFDSLALSADGTAIAYVRLPGTNPGSAFEPSESSQPELYFQRKRIGKHFKVVTHPVIDPGGKHVAFVANTDQGFTVAVDDERTPPGSYDHVLEIAFDPTGKKLAFVANVGGKPGSEFPGEIVGGECFVVTRALGGDAKPVESRRYATVRDLVWDAVGERIAYRIATGSGWQIACGDAHSPTHASVGTPAFVGSRIRYGARDDRELWVRHLALP